METEIPMAVRRIFIDRDPGGGSPDDDGRRRVWLAKWIRAAGDNGLCPGVWAFRRRFKLESSATLRLHVTADQRYDLWIDGAWAGFGSERGLHNSWFYESYEVDLAAGCHVIVARVWWTGEASPMTHTGHATADRPGFLLHAEEPFDRTIDTAPETWEALPLAGYSLLNPWDQYEGVYVEVGARTKLDGRSHPWGFEAGECDGWTPAVANGLPLRFRATPTFVGKWHCLTPGTLPPMRQSRGPCGEVRFAVALPLDKTGAPGGSPADFGRDPVCVAASDRARAQAWGAMLAGNGGPVIIPARSAQRIIVDFGTYVCAFPRVVLSGGGGADISVRWAEALLKDPAGIAKGRRDDIDGKYFRGLADIFVADGGAHRQFESLWFEAGRFAEIVVRTADEPLAVESLSLRETHYPIDWAYRFETDDSRWAAALPIMGRTLEMCSHESYFDCPYYEQLMYGGDTRLEVLATYATTRDDRLPRKAMVVFDRTRSEAGFTLSRQSPDEPLVIPTYALHFVQMVADYALWRGDRDFVRKRLSGVRAVLQAWGERIGVDGLVRNPLGWNFIDWNPTWEGGVQPNGGIGCVSPVNNLHFAWTLKMAADVEDWVGDPEFSAWDRRQAERIGRAVVAAYWDEDRHLFAEDESHTRFIEHTQCMAALGGFVPQGADEAFGESLATAPDLDRASVYYRSYLIDAFRALRRPLDMHRCFDLWFTLKPLGLRTVLEQPEPSRSDCHAWGSHPMYHAIASVAGIRPAAPGFASVLIEPLPGPLRRLRCEVPHPSGGAVSLDIALENGHWIGAAETPKGTPATLILNGKTHTWPGGPISIA